jgi:hypothetical protein
MKKLVMVIGLAAFLAGCCSSHEGGTGDESSSSSGVQFHNNASNGTGSTVVNN